MGNENKDFRTPGQLIEHLLALKGWTKKTLAVILNVSESRVVRLTGDKQPVDAKLALVLEEVFGDGPRPASAAKGTTVPAKYRHPVTGETWSGRGKPPKWLAAEMGKGKKASDFAI